MRINKHPISKRHNYTVFWLSFKFLYTIHLYDLPSLQACCRNRGLTRWECKPPSPFGEPPTLPADSFKLFPDIIPGDIFLFNIADNILMLFQQLLFAGIVRREKGHHPSFYLQAVRLAQDPLDILFKFLINKRPDVPPELGRYDPAGRSSLL